MEKSTKGSIEMSNDPIGPAKPIIKNINNFKNMIDMEVVIHTPKDHPKDGIKGKLSFYVDDKQREVFKVGEKKFLFKNVVWWEPKYTHIDNTKCPLIKIDMNRK